jgi:predicted nuclease of predicted toxin-antitoxin system
MVDMPVSPDVAAWLRTLGHDAVHARELGLDRSPDSVIMNLAAEQGRVVVTADLDFPRLLALSGDAGPGLILLRGGNYSETEIRERLARVLELVPAGELGESVVVVEKGRLRRTHLPLERETQ